MQIQSIEIYQYPIPIEPFTIATGTMYTAQNIFIRIRTDVGISGVGECSAFPMIVGETQATDYAMAKDFGKIWLHKNPLEIEQRMAELHTYAYGNYTIKSAFDMALYDIAARHAALPLYQFLGAKSRRQIITDMTIGIDTPEIMAAKALEYVQRGFKTLKIKVGKNTAEDVARLTAIRQATGDGINIRIDANQGWNREQAQTILQELTPFHIEFCEQPMRKYLDEQLPALRSGSPIPIMADESVFTHYDAEWIAAHHAADYINIKFAKCGGILEAIQIHDTAQKNHIPCMLGSMLESRLALTANAHFATAYGNIRFFDLDTALLGQLADPVIGGMQYEVDHIILSDGPGLDADVDQAYLNKQEHIIIR